MRHWLIKSEPSVYAFADLVRDGRTAWEGVRNFEARNHLRAMKRGDLCLFYHSNEGKAVVGVAKVVKEAYADPTADEGAEGGAKKGDWSVVDVAPVVALKRPVELDALRAAPGLAEMQIFKRNRLSVVPVTDEEFAEILAMAKTKLAKR